MIKSVHTPWIKHPDPIIEPTTLAAKIALVMN